MSTVLTHMRRIWRDHIAGPTLRSYDEACADLGGVPWRPAQETDRWFLVARPESLSQSQPVLPSFDKLATLDTGTIRLKRTMTERTKLLLLAGAALLVIGVCVVLLSGGTRAVSPSVASSVTQPSGNTQPAAIARPATAAAPARIAPPVDALRVPAPPAVTPQAGSRLALAKRHIVARRHRR
jgi:hypothetical protein